jgi:hypothetical protein
MDTSRIKEIAKKTVIEHFSNPDILKDLCTPDFSVHFSWGDDIKGVEQTIAMLKEFGLNPRVKVLIDDCFAEDNKVVLRFRVIFPLEGSKEVIRNEISIIRFQGEKIAEWWAAFDRQSEKW